MEAEKYIAPELEDILLSDVKEEDLKTTIAGLLGVEYLSDTTEQPMWPQTGIILDKNSRVLVNLIVERSGRKKNVFFLVSLQLQGCNLAFGMKNVRVNMPAAAD